MVFEFRVIIGMLVSGVSEIIFVEYRTSVIINNMYISFLMVHSQLNEMEKPKECLGRQGLIKLLMEMIHMNCLMDMVILCLNIRFLVNVPSMIFRSSTNIGCLSLSHEEGMVVDYHSLCLLMSIMERSMRVTA